MTSEYPRITNFGIVGDIQNQVLGSPIASAAIISPDRGIHHVTGVAAINTITIPWDGFAGTIFLIADGLWTWTNAGNINSAGSVATVGQVIQFTYDLTANKWFPIVSGASAAGNNTWTGTNEFTGQTNISGPDANTNVEIGSVSNDANAGTGGTSVVIGNSANNSNGTGVVVIGSSATSTSGSNNIAIGLSANGSGGSSISIGVSSSSGGGASNTTVGTSATGSASGTGVAVGTSAISGGANSVAIGANSNSGSGGTSVAIGQGAVNTSNVAGAVLIGQGAAIGIAGADVVGIGRAVIPSGGSNVVIGTSASSGGFAGVKVFGTSSLATANNQFVAGSAVPTNEVYFGKGVVNATPTAYTINGTGGSGTNIAGADIHIAGGKGTGNAKGGDTSLQAAFPLGSGTTLQTLYDRTLVVGGLKALTGGAATAVVRFGVPQGLDGGFGATVFYSIRASDGADFQIRRGSVHIAAVNKAGTEVPVLSAASEAADGSIIAQSSASTLTYAITAASSVADTVDLSFNVVSGLVETTLDIQYTVLRDHGTGTITPL